MGIEVTDFAVEKILEMMEKNQKPGQYLYVSLHSGGCSGFTYNFDIIPEPPHEKDKIFQFGDLQVCVDMKSYLFLNGSTIDYKDGVFSSGIEIVIPTATGRCGCGESVSF